MDGAWLSTPRKVDRSNACGHDDRGGPEATADVGHPGPRLQLVHHPVEGREPGLHQVRLVAGPEQPQRPGVQPLVVGAPVDALAGRERADERVVVDVAGRDRLEGTGEEHRALVGQHERVLGTELEGPVVGVVGDVAAGGLVAQPLADVPLVRAGALGQVGRRHRPRPGHRPVEPEAVAQVHHQARDGRGEVAHRLVDELLQRGLVEARCVDRGHVVSLAGVALFRTSGATGIGGALTVTRGCPPPHPCSPRRAPRTPRNGYPPPMWAGALRPHRFLERQTAATREEHDHDERLRLDPALRPARERAPSASAPPRWRRHGTARLGVGPLGSGFAWVGTWRPLDRRRCRPRPPRPR